MNDKFGCWHDMAVWPYLLRHCSTFMEVAVNGTDWFHISQPISLTLLILLCEGNFPDVSVVYVVSLMCGRFKRLNYVHYSPLFNLLYHTVYAMCCNSCTILISYLIFHFHTCEIWTFVNACTY